MKKTTTRCFLVFHNDGHLYNERIYIVDNDGWTDRVLGICTNCGDLFVVTIGDAISKRLSNPISQMAKLKRCPGCGVELNKTLQNYPANYLNSRGAVSIYREGSGIEELGSSVLIETWDLNS